MTDDCGPAESDPARLTYNKRGNGFNPAEFDLHIVAQPTDTLGSVNGVATFEVVALPENATYVWRKNGVAIVPPETNSVLTISPVSPGDVGAYDVVVSLAGDDVYSSAASLTVNDVPTITMHPSNQTVPQGSPASFSVTATGDGQLDYQWQRQNTPNGPWNNVSGGTSPTLTIPVAQGATAGRYRCRVKNHCGATFSNAANLSISF